MDMANEILTKSIENWCSSESRAKLPAWEELPDIELYMDQTVLLLNRYLFPSTEGREKGVTATMINNYVKMKVVPAPVNKRYSRRHLAYLIIICMLKQSMNISDLQKLFPVTDEEEAIRVMYCEFIYICEECRREFGVGMRAALGSIHHGQNEEQQLRALIVRSSVYANLYKVFTEGIVSSLFDTDAAGQE